MTNREQFKLWTQEHGYTPQRVVNETGLPRGAIEHWFYGKDDFEPSKIKPEYRAKLYALTNLEIFRATPQMVAGENVDISKLNAWQKDLLRWIADSSYNRERLQKETKLGKGNISTYCTKPTKLTKVMQKNRDALYTVTKLESLRGNGEQSCYDLPQVQQAPVNGSIDSLVAAVSDLQKAVLERMPLPKENGSGNIVHQASELFYALAGKLEHFKTSPSDREKLTKKLAKADVGRVTSLLHAIYKSQDDFDQWMFLSGYAYQGDKDGRKNPV